MAVEVTKTMTIGELLQVAPQTAPVLMEVGMHCLGCPASQVSLLKKQQWFMELMQIFLSQRSTHFSSRSIDRE